MDRGIISLPSSFRCTTTHSFLAQRRSKSSMSLDSAGQGLAFFEYAARIGGLKGGMVQLDESRHELGHYHWLLQAQLALFVRV